MSGEEEPLPYDRGGWFPPEATEAQRDLLDAMPVVTNWWEPRTVSTTWVDVAPEVMRLAMGIDPARCPNEHGPDGIIACWSPGGPCPEGQTSCESCGPCAHCASARPVFAAQATTRVLRRPVAPRKCRGLTGKAYRIARRRYAREVRAWKRGEGEPVEVHYYVPRIDFSEATKSGIRGESLRAFIFDEALPGETVTVRFIENKWDPR